MRKALFMLLLLSGYAYAICDLEDLRNHTVAYYSLDENGFNYLDKTENNFDLTNGNASNQLSSPTKIGNAQDFIRANTDRIWTSASESWELTSPTVSGWVYFSPITNNQAIFDFSDYISYNYYGFNCDIIRSNHGTYPNRFRCVAQDGQPDSTSMDEVRSSFVLQTGKWYYLTASFNGDINMYINGSLAGIEYREAATNIVYPSGTLTSYSLGDRKFNQKYSSTELLDSTVDEIAIFDKVLSQDCINFLYNNGNPGLEQQYPFLLEMNLSNITCISPDPDDNSEPYTIEDGAPSFTFFTNIDAWCRIDNEDLAYDEMTVNCSDGNYTRYHICSVSGSDPVQGIGTQYAYISCAGNGIVHNSSSNEDLELYILTASGDDVQNAIMSGVQKSSIWPGANIYYNQQVYLRRMDGDSILDDLEAVVAYGNQRWLFSHTNTTKVGLFNLTPAIYVLDMVNMTTTDIQLRVASLINSTKN